MHIPRAPVEEGDSKTFLSILYLENPERSELKQIRIDDTLLLLLLLSGLTVACWGLIFFFSLLFAHNLEDCEFLT